MSLDDKKYLEPLDDYKLAHECILQSNSPTDALPSYQYLYDLKNSISNQLYAYCFRKLLQFNTANVSNEFRLQMFEGVNREDIMYQDELDAIENEFDDIITVYRGAPSAENEPGICWTINKSTAEEYPFNRGKVFMARIPKSSILLYFAHEENEGEIIAHITSGYEVIKE